MNKEEYEFIIKDLKTDIQSLKQQLAEKDKEIEKFISALEYNENNIPNQRKAIRHQVCEEIRKWAEENKVYCDENNHDACLEVSATNSTLFALKEFLSEIEKGE